MPGRWLCSTRCTPLRGFAFAAGHVAGALNVGLDGSFATHRDPDRGNPGRSVGGHVEVRVDF